MAWFDDVQLPGATITGSFGFIREDGIDPDTHPDVRLASGSVTFTPTVTAVRAGGAWLGISPIRARIFEGDLVVSEEDPRPVRILSTDAETGVAGWGWIATFDVTGASIKPIRFLAPATGVHLTGDGLIPITGAPVEVIAGPAGPSAYDVAVTNGYTGTEAEWLESLHGKDSAWADITGKPTTFPPTLHTHDDRYYTETEVDAKITAALVGPGTMGNPIDLGTAHLDTRTDPNHYAQRFSARSTKANGYPYEGRAGVLEVMAWIPTSGVIQRWTSQAGGVATRYMLNGAWQQWQNAIAQTIT